MKLRFQTVLFLALLAPAAVLPSRAQSESPGTEDTPLGDIARNLRKSKKPPVVDGPVITNENLGKMQQLIRRQEQQALDLTAQAPVQSSKPQGPQVTCSFAFSAQDNPVKESTGPAQQDLPESELAKLDGPAVISGDTLQLSIYNGTNFRVDEITVGLTIVRRDNRAAASFGTAHLVPASGNAGPVPMLKKSDSTLLYHLKGSAAPGSTTGFQHALGLNLSPDQEWHWAILQARGTHAAAPQN
jgi:hypothetical protein